MNVSDTLLPTDFFKLADEILGKRKHVKALIAFYKSYSDKVRLWVDELDQAISFFNSQRSFPEECINAIYLKKILKDNLLLVKDVGKENQYFRSTLEAMNSFGFFDDDWQLDKLAAACLVAFYRTFMLVSQPYLKDQKAQVASAIEEVLALMALEGKKTELFQAIKFWIEDWQKEGFSQELASKIRVI
ncbi:hypothetical protein COX59_04065 [Candidatus Beckwithbacteria bacterium CG_4_10_14_0_2_um_filter_47_25]|uniref:Uncharacterized protein n=3 Tax=Candidatus Beckwithiibacteriota TaxID=1752726 RepID=A0A2H0B2E4_9BACT|nr:MAG: hypothetical protein COX09_04970 [Candidatus Beckwithbacteria bacterium CG23_combo_of_CG06-09_8_20_14_all_47_9]PJA21490.1 MAG: hypothetical protein COX59_04065 [Candidatus Beckwithbacteria bacterium CG_4_10_14_0_2_um_filter_47_25]